MAKGVDGKGKFDGPEIRKGEARPSPAQPEERAQFMILRANRMLEVGEPDEALVAIEEAVGIWRRLMAVRPEPSRPPLGLALGIRGSVLAALHRHEDAVESLEEALKMITPALEQSPGPVAPLAASLLKDYVSNAEAADLEPADSVMRPVADVLLRAGFDVGEEARAASAGFDLDAPRPDRSEPEKLAQYLIARSRYLNEVENYDAALEAIDEAVEVWRELYDAGKEIATPGLTLALGLRGDVLRGLVRTEEAAESFAEGLRVITPLFVEKPQVYVTLASALFRDYITCAEESGLEIDEEMIQPAFEALQELGVIDLDDEGVEDEEEGEGGRGGRGN
jgi:tetratricopeptide (TPR) repeat protein